MHKPKFVIVLTAVILLLLALPACAKAKKTSELKQKVDVVADDVREKVEAKKQAIIAGAFEVFPGMADNDLRGMYYFESNVVGELP